jgi:glutathione synthase/RimK-type ligase-like ATP-grasp enzyme
MDERSEDWFPLLTESGSIMLREYIKSNRHRRRGVVVDGQVVDEETGEII